MMTIGDPIKTGREGYYIERAQEKYYTESAEERGEWFGKGAKALGLEGAVTTESFQNLLRGFSPDGRLPLVQNAGRPDRCMGWDLTFSAPKSVSVLWALSPEDVRAEILQAHQRAVTQTLRQLEDTLAVSRSGKAGAVHERAGLAVVVQQHYASRTNDVQIHSHAVVNNVGVRADGSTGALHSINWYRAKKVLGAAYQARLASELRHGLGLTIETRKDSFHIRGVPEETCDVFSKRRHDIVREMHERKEEGAIAAQKAALKTRPKKQNIPLDQLLVKWQEEAKAHGWGAEQAGKLLQAAREQKVKNEPAREQAVTPVVAQAASQPKDQGIANAQDQSRSSATDGAHAAKPVESTKAVQSPQNKAEVQRQSDRSEKPKAHSMKSAEAHPSTSNQRATDDASRTKQSPASKQKKAKAHGRQSARVDEDANQRDSGARTDSEHGHEHPGSLRSEWIDASGAFGRLKKDPFRYLFEKWADKTDCTFQQNTNAANPTDEWKLRLVAPESVSVMWALASQPIRKTIEEAHQAAADYALRQAELNLRFVRRDETGAVKEQGTLAPTSTEHQTIRREAPFLRTNATLKIEGLRPQGEGASDQAAYTVTGKMAVRLIYEVQLAAELQQRLGLSVEPNRKGFCLAGMHQVMCEGFTARCEKLAQYVREDDAHDQRGKADRPGWYRRLRPQSLQQVARASTKEERQSALWDAVGESFGWTAARTRQLFGKHRKQRRATRAFKNAFEDAQRRIFPEKQTGRLLSWLATKFAIEQGAGASELLRTLQKLRPAAERSWIHIEWRALFPKAPSWSPLKNLKAPVLAIGNRSRRWDKILWRQNLILGELRLQQRRLFPRAPSWSPVHGLKLPTLRITSKSAHSPQPQKLKQHEQQHGH